MSEFQTEHTSLPSSLVVSYICIVFLFMIHVFVVFYVIQRLSRTPSPICFTVTPCGNASRSTLVFQVRRSNICLRAES